MFEIDGETFREGDVIHFSRAGMSQNRVRDYQIDMIHPDGIVQVSANGIHYTYSRAEVASLGITHANDTTEK
ncbi:hypothetical protein [Streptomyces sp. NPDC059631]|uniref:hypothetical protein n=1 Tax=unclassified Streptomyces TaxID=2593676 RepID=UPI0036AFB2A8